MSVQTLPRWQRALLRWFFERKLRKQARSFPCLHCQGSVPLPRRLNDALWDMLVICPHCGHASPLMELASGWNKTPEEQLAEGRIAVTTPADTRITVEDTGASRIWTLPARGGWNGLLGFGTLWVSFCTLVFGIMLAGGAAEGQGAAVLLFMGTFVLVGIGMIYAGLRQSHAHQVLSVDSVELIHERRLFGSVKRKALPRQEISSVELVVFYSENYKPVHGIEIKAGHRKIRFGSGLTPEEKAWLCDELRQATLIHHEPRVPGAGPDALRQDTDQAPDSVLEDAMSIEQYENGCVVRLAPGNCGKMLMIPGAVIVAFTAFMITMGLRMWMPRSDGAPLFFWLLWNGFCLFWCGGVATFALMGLGVLVAGWRMNRTHFQITATPEALQVIETCGRRQHETLVHASEVQDIRTGVFQTFRNNSDSNEPTEVQHRGLIVLHDRVVGFGGGRKLHELNQAVAAIKVALGLA